MTVVNPDLGLELEVLSVVYIDLYNVLLDVLLARRLYYIKI